MDYLSYEDQFKEVLNQEELSRIQNQEIRKIREKYWRLQHEAFINEHEIPDSDLDNVSEELVRREQEKLQRFKSNSTE
ncbi:hypothetical protein [Cohnella terricola]|uniref:Uncharacterized protein n=1 Tax=Cohnella terricola TaxID=1289167 RepID=A0A559JX48_9BACL|nr:hypothetical protein [Cohnella terricola]TVY04468.1 hypothetical protein FPZ45_02490 [Cohnella terricola]